MADLDAELNEHFAPHGDALRPEVLMELNSILRIHNIDPEELSYKWESYCMKMGAEETKLDLKTARDFKKDLQEILERETRAKQAKAMDKRPLGGTPRVGAGGDVLGMLDGLIPNTPRAGVMRTGGGSTVKRKSAFETPMAKASKMNFVSSPGELKTPDLNGVPTANFEDRPNAGQIVETLNDHIPVPDAPDEPAPEPRIKLKANTDLSKFSYKTMAMKLSEASEVLDDRIDEFITLVQEHHKLEDGDFGNPCDENQSEIVAVGRIASDSLDGKLNPASVVLETSRRTGSGHRIPLKLENIPSFELFPGKIVAVRGTNASGEFFSVNSFLTIPILPPAASEVVKLDEINARLGQSDDLDPDPTDARPLNILIASGPYTTDTALNYSPLRALLTKAQETNADMLILSGPFLDAEHPKVQTGDVSLPESWPVPPDRATLTDVFRYHISTPIIELTQAVPTISIIMCPSVRDVISKHAAWPQDRLQKKDLGLPKQVSIVTNPVTLSLNEFVAGISSQDVLDQLRACEIAGGKARQENVLARLCRQVVEQRHFFPVYPPLDRQPPGGNEDDGDRAGEVKFAPLGAMLDVSYLKLGEWLNVRPDVLITPSVLPPFAKVIESVLAINPGTLSKKRGPGTYARMTVLPPKITDSDREKDELVAHRMFARSRVDIIRI
ncbi:DNA polymerase subunit alpha B [Trichodelitschia bisporula]|uniref:DNA polymerase alpha subunit B n=1 Tax=Trichodelitschia bisporula TaxID=703511 RepID=A0A6G1HRU7_9PEZI|nr:DNA polymerase subunit alpha B [Trichodelitschia bisporula]